MAEPVGWKGQLKIFVQSGHKLMVADLTTSDPYVLVEVNFKDPSKANKYHVAHYKTKVKQRTLNPDWNELFEIPLDLPNGDLRITFHVWDKDVGMKDDFLGYLDYEVSKEDEGQVKTLELKSRPDLNDKVKTGSLSFSVAFHKNAPAVSTNQYQVYSHKATGFMRALNASDSIRTYNTYRIQIFHIDQIFEEFKQHWNEKYDAAIKIYGSNAIRTSIRLQHSSLYGGSSASKGILKNGDQLLQLLNHGIYGGRPRFFTYALMDREIFFSETGAAFFSDFTSKHAMHSNCSEHVRYAGEFHLRKGPNDKYRLVIDNNSGTFGPDPLKLPALKLLMEVNFPGLEVEVLSFSDAQLKLYKEEFDKL